MSWEWLVCEPAPREPPERVFQAVRVLLSRNPNVLGYLNPGAWPPRPSSPPPVHRPLRGVLAPGRVGQGWDRGAHVPGKGWSEASLQASPKLGSVSPSVPPPRGDDQESGGHSVWGCLWAPPSIAMAMTRGEAGSHTSEVTKCAACRPL